MGRLYAKIRAKFPKETVNAGQNESLSFVVSNPVAGVVDTDDTQNDLPIYEATAKELSYWHAFGCNGFLQTLLREYDLDYGSANIAAYDYFKIGMDEKRHVATFAIDATHYHLIQFDKYNAQPLDKVEARRVLEKISAIRIATRRYKDFCGFQIECFD